MRSNTYSDHQLVDMIRAGGKSRNEALKSMYLEPSLKQSVFKALKGLGAQESDMYDTYQDALIILDKNVRTGKFDSRSSLATYFVAIAKWHQLSKLRKGRKTELNDDMSIYDSLDDNQRQKLIDDEEKDTAMRETLKKIGDKCQTLLLLYMQNISMKEIAERSSINVQSAKNAVHRCRTKLRELIAKNPKWSRLIKETR